MTIIDTAKITSKGQITVPNRIRKILHLREGLSVAFGISRQGIVLLPCKIDAVSPYSSEEWGKIEKLSLIKGKICKTDKSAKNYIENL